MLLNQGSSYWRHSRAPDKTGEFGQPKWLSFGLISGKPIQTRGCNMLGESISAEERCAARQKSALPCRSALKPHRSLFRGSAATAAKFTAGGMGDQEGTQAALRITTPPRKAPPCTPLPAARLASTLPSPVHNLMSLHSSQWIGCQSDATITSGYQDCHCPQW